jgi:hypothetical protein
MPMNPLRKTAVIIAGMLLPVVLFSFGFLLSVSQVLGTPDRLKQSLKDSNIYEAAVTDLINTGGSQGSGGVSADDAAVQDAVSNALSAETLKTQTDEIVNGVYAWLRGDTPTLDFQVDLTGIRDELTANLSKQAADRTADLPVCPAGTPVSSVTNLDPFNATCRPQGITSANAAAITRQEIESSDLFRQPVLTPNDFNGEGGKPLEEQLKPVSNVYDAVRKFMLISGLSGVALIAIIIAASRPWRSGLRRVSVTLISVGAPSVILSLLSGWATRAAVDAVARDSGNDTIQTAGIKAVEALTNDIRTWWLWYGIVLVALGVGALVWLMATKQRQQLPPRQGRGSAQGPAPQPRPTGSAKL